MNKILQVVLPAFFTFWFAMSLRSAMGAAADPYIYLAGFLAGYMVDTLYFGIFDCNENWFDDNEDEL